jgi:hypothetical protein
LPNLTVRHLKPPVRSRAFLGTIPARIVVGLVLVVTTLILRGASGNRHRARLVARLLFAFVEYAILTAALGTVWYQVDSQTITASDPGGAWRLVWIVTMAGGSMARISGGPRQAGKRQRLAANRGSSIC